ncbi:type II secretion system F family protein [Algiphilus sp. W345]|uniref:Type II secretion system F family protein n=1 Tax=Banduia mediterranea TaxID=3075609 RepID=A0ABU2WGU1_9GAMM|nr:type II secretion system F family protein [Algiphilus sp. W345]MDT0496765.1 type II secretion system F family protein [Algiphilus sp. W345]
MSQEMIWIFALAAFALVVSAFILLARAGRREKQEEVLLRLRAGEDAGLPSPIEDGDEGWLRPVYHLVWRTGSDATPRSITIGLAVLVVLLILLPLALGVLVGLAALAILLVLGYGLLQRQGAKRRARILEQLPDFLESAMRVLVAGNTLEEALFAAANDSHDPIRTLFLRISRQVRLGAPIDEVLGRYADLYRMRDLKVMAIAASINRRYGGSMRNVVRSLITAIRNRELASRELRALTAETRFSALVLAIVPIGLTLYILARNPAYYLDMWLTTGGKITLMAAVGLQVAGVYVLWRMLRGVEDADR